MIWATDHTGQTAYLSPEWHAFTGQPVSEALGMGWIEAIHPEDRSAIRDAFLEANRRRVEFVLHYRLRRHDGSYAWVVDTAAPSFNPQTSAFLGYLGSVCGLDPAHLPDAVAVELGGVDARVAEGEFAAVSDLDRAADLLISARGAAFGANDDLVRMIDAALFSAARAIVARAAKRGGSMH